MPFEGGGYDPTNVAGFIRGLISEGEGPTRGLEIFRREGGQTNDSRWFAAYRQVAGLVAAEPQMLGVDPLLLPTADQYRTAEMSGRPGFATEVQIQMIDRATGAWVTQKALYKTDQPHTPQEAANWANDRFENAPGETGTGFVVMGAVAVHLWQTVPYGSLA